MCNTNRDRSRGGGVVHRLEEQYWKFNARKFKFTAPRTAERCCVHSPLPHSPSTLNFISTRISENLLIYHQRPQYRMSAPTQPENAKPSIAEEQRKLSESKELPLRQISQKDFELNWNLFLLQAAKPLKDLEATNEKMSLLAKSYLEEKMSLESKLNAQLTINQELQKKFDDQAALVTSMQTKIDGFETRRRNFLDQAALYDDLLKTAQRKDTAQQELIETQRANLKEIKLCGLGSPESLDAMVTKLMEEKANLYMHKFTDREKKIEDLAKELDGAEKTIRDLEKSVRNMGRREQELTEKLALKEKRLEEMESGIRAQVRDVKLREDAVKERELKIKEQQRRVAVPTESTKEATKELKTAKAQWEKQLREAERRIDGLEQELKDLTEKYDILQLDYDATVADRQNANNEPDNLVMEKLHMLEEDRDYFKSLYEASRSNEKIIQHRISQAVRIAEATQDATFNTWKAKQKEVILDADRKLAAAEAKVEVAEMRASNMGFARKARVSEILDRMDESIKETELLKEQLSSLVMGKEKL